MTTVHVSLTRDDGTSTTAAAGVLEWEPTTRRESGDDVVLPQGFVARLVAGEATVTVAPSDGLTWCWRVTERVKDGTVRYVAVPDSVTTVEYTDLVDVDPDTLAAWEPTVSAVYQAALDLKADATDVTPAFKTVTNRTGTAIPADTLVEIDGAFGTSSTVRVADNTTADHVAGITVAEIADGASGDIQVTGTVEGLNTSAFTAGAPLYLGTSGAWTETRPTAPAHIIRVGVAGVTHPTAGTVVFTLPAFEILAENVDGLDAKVTELAEDPTSDLGASLSSTYAAIEDGTYSAFNMLAKIRAGIEDVSVLVLGDSTGNNTGEWPDLALRDVQSAYPTHTLATSAWDDATKTWGAASTTVAGSGDRTITLYNASVSGQRFLYAINPAYFATLVSDIQPDLILISYGHNEGSTVVDYDGFRDQIFRLVEALKAGCPVSPVVLMSQNQRIDAAAVPNIAAYRARAARQAAAVSGIGFVDVNAAFLESDDVSALLEVDGLHPNAAGSRLWADTVGASLRWRPNATPRPTPPSSFIVPATNLLTNGDFSDFDGATAPPGWALSGCTVAKDTTNYETGSWALKITKSGASAGAVQQNLPLKLLKANGGEWVTVAVRVRIPDGAPYTAGRVGLYDGKSNKVSPGTGGVRDGFFWEILHKKFDSTAAYAQVQVFADTGTAVGVEITVDRVILARGLLPRDMF